MSWFKPLSLVLLLAACGFEPVNAPGGAGAALQGQVQVAAPESREAFLLVQRLEERLGRTSLPAYELSLNLSLREQSLAINPEGDVQRFNVIGIAEFALRDLETGEVAQSGLVQSFTGYSATSTTVAALAAERDAFQRLMVILADQIVLRLQASDT